MVRLVVSSGPLAGTSFDIAMDAGLTIGGENAAITLPDEETSRRHAVVRRDERGVVLEDVGSRDGTWVDGRRIEGAIRLHGGERIRMGGTTLILESDPGPEPPGAPLLPPRAPDRVTSAPAAPTAAAAETLAAPRPSERGRFTRPQEPTAQAPPAPPGHRDNAAREPAPLSAPVRPSERERGAPPDTPALPLTRWIAALVVLFLVDAAQLLILLPDRTGELFAWQIQPELTSFVLGSAYVGGGYFFVRVFAGSPWRHVSAGFLPIVIFVWSAGLATLIHSDRLNQGTLPFLVWTAVYVVTPLLIPALYLANRRVAGRAATGERLPRGTRLLLGIAGGTVIGAGLLMFLAPAAAIDAWPWALTPLTTRVVAAVMAMFGGVWVSVALNGDAVAARIPLESHAIGLACMVWGLMRAQESIDWSNALGPVFLAVVAGMLATSAAVRTSLRRQYLILEDRRHH